jgi:hypothetical protein
MFIFLSKFLPPLLYPLGLACLSILVALLLQKRPRLQRGVLLLALSLLWVGGNRWAAMALLRPLEWRYLPQGIEINNVSDRKDLLGALLPAPLKKALLQ